MNIIEPREIFDCPNLAHCIDVTGQVTFYTTLYEYLGGQIDELRKQEKPDANHLRKLGNDAREVAARIRVLNPEVEHIFKSACEICPIRPLRLVDLPSLFDN